MVQRSRGRGDVIASTPAEPFLNELHEPDDRRLYAYKLLLRASAGAPSP